ncbi:MAG TPA: hypothetical protein DHU96_17275 [Actinobacteria bacterium]|nr:hypothetical protein [Actinomycetota bacterium]
MHSEEHYRQAEALAERIDVESDYALPRLASAQVHATLALVGILKDVFAELSMLREVIDQSDT